MGESDATDNTAQAKDGFWRRVWRQPRKWFLLGIPIGGFAMFFAGILFWGGLHTAIDLSDSLTFCTSCHEMQVNFDEYAKTVHYKNPAGVRAICSDCHVPRPWGPMILAKMRATFIDVPNHILGTIDTPEKFEAHRLEFAKRVWKRMKADNSRECRNCHSYEAMALADQGHSASRKHSPEWRKRTGDTCIDCHKGVAHKLPEGL